MTRSTNASWKSACSGSRMTQARALLRASGERCPRGRIAMKSLRSLFAGSLLFVFAAGGCGSSSDSSEDLSQLTPAELCQKKCDLQVAAGCEKTPPTTRAVARSSVRQSTRSSRVAARRRTPWMLARSSVSTTVARRGRLASCRWGLVLLKGWPAGLAPGASWSACETLIGV